MRKTVQIAGISLILSTPDEIPRIQWIGGELYLSQLLAAWTIVDKEHDIPMSPQILGKPGVGKTTLAYSAAKSLNLPVYIFQCTVDTRPEDLLITPVIGGNNTIEYHASPLVTAMIEGGICILDEANRMAEKSWASLAPLLDRRRYVESVIAGIKLSAHPNFRICVTMNEDSSTFEIPEYIHSRLQPQIFIEFPDSEEEYQILKFNIPYSPRQIIDYTVNFLQRAHKANKDYTIRDGINICRYYLKIEQFFFNKYQSQKSFSYLTPNEERNNFIRDKSSNNSKNDQDLEKTSTIRTKSPNKLSNEVQMDSFHEKSQDKQNQKNGINKKLFQQAIFYILGEEGYNFYLGKKPTKSDHFLQFQDIFDQLNAIFYDENIDNPEYHDDLSPDEENFNEEFENNQEKTEKYHNFRNEEPFFDELDAFDEEDEDFLDLLEKSDVKWNSEKERKDFLEPILDDDLDERLKKEPLDRDPNEIIREFLERKYQEKKKRLKKEPSEDSKNKKLNHGTQGKDSNDPV